MEIWIPNPGAMKGKACTWNSVVFAASQSFHLTLFDADRDCDRQVFAGTSFVAYAPRQVNPDLSEGGKGDSAADSAADTAADGANVSVTRTKRGSAEARPGLMRTTFDEWDTLLVRKGPVLIVRKRRVVTAGCTKQVRHKPSYAK